MAWTLRTHRSPQRHNEVAATEARLDQIAGELQTAHSDISMRGTALRQVADQWDSFRHSLEHRHRHAS